MDPIRAIILDLDDTLYAYEPCHEEGLKAVQARCLTTLKWDNTTFEGKFRSARKRVKEQVGQVAACHHRLLYFQNMVEGEPYRGNRWQFIEELHDTYWEAFLRILQPRDGVVEFLVANTKLKKMILSDFVASIQYRKIARLGIGEHIGYLATSEEIGTEKPDPLCFDYCLRKLQLPREQVCVVGDDFARDIVGAEAAGLRAFWLNPNCQSPPSTGSFVTVESFRELTEHLHDA